MFAETREIQFDPPTNGTETSNAAAKSVAPITGRQRKAMLQYFRSLSVFGSTDEEMADAMHEDISANAIRPRRGELVKAGMVEDSNKRRKTRSGHLAIVWHVTEKGLAQ